MPHCILEYSDNISDKPDFYKLLNNLNQKLAETGHFKLNDIKSRAIQHNAYVIGDNDSFRAFVTLNIQILDGRTDEVKTGLSQLALDILKQYFPETLKKNKASLTVQITDIHRASYKREIS
ncbi:MAG: 5-carboxymethyl-2-hydroxymuconate Delta-isomerase [Candidatus Zixiibacteriota bacterium]